VALHHLVTSLKLGPFSDNLCKKLAASMDELRQRAVKFMQFEKIREFKTKLTDVTENRKTEKEAYGGVQPPR